MPSKVLIPHKGQLFGQHKYYCSTRKRTGGALRALASKSSHGMSNAGILHKDFTRMTVNAPAPRKKKYLSF